MDRKLVLGIDFNNVFFSHYYSKPLKNSKGKNVQAIKGFMYRLKNLREMFNPDYIVIARDISRERTFRKELYPEYKGTRKESDEDFRFQMGETLRLLALMGYPVLCDERYEADDVLGMISKLSEELGMDCIIISSDKDLYQLITDHVSIYSFRKDVMVDKQYMLDEYGLTPGQWVDLKILQGDRSDNIPGMMGIGPKTALELMKGFGSIQGIYDNIDKLSQSLKIKLEMSKSMIPISRRLVTIVTDYKILGYTDKSMQRTEYFKDDIYKIIGDLEIPTLFNVVNYGLLPMDINKQLEMKDQFNNKFNFEPTNP